MAFYTPSNNFVFVTTNYTPSNSFVFSAVGAADNDSALAVTLDDATLSSSADVRDVFACLSVITLDDATLSSSAVLHDWLISSLSVTLDEAVLSASNGVYDWVIGSIANTLDDAELSSSANMGVVGSAAIALDAVVLVANCAVPNECDFIITLDDAELIANCAVISNAATLSATLSDAVLSAAGFYDANVHRFTLCSALSDSQQCTSLSINTASSLNEVAFNQVAVCANSQDTTLEMVTVLSSVLNLLPLTANAHATQHAATPLSLVTLGVIDTVIFSMTDRCITLQNTVAMSYGTLSIQDVLVFMLPVTHSNVEDMAQQTYSWFKQVYDDGDNPYTPSTDFVFVPADYTPLPAFNFGTHPVIDLRLLSAKGICANAFNAVISLSELQRRKFCALLTNAIKPPFGVSPFIDQPRPPPIPPVNGVSIIIPTREAYTVHHVISVVTVIGNHIIPLSKLSLSYNRDSFCWLFSGELADKAALPLVTPIDNNPVELSITINGYHWVVIVEKMPESKRFGKTAITLTGKSLSGLLGELYQRQISYTAGSDMTIQQIANALLPIGWSIDWQCATPWVIPANTFSYTQQNTLQALATIVRSIGAVLKPSRTERVLTIQPCYPILPWNYYASGITPNLVVPDSAIDTISIESTVQSAINGVYVHGDQNGVLALCRLTGTAGDVLAPTQSNPLITDVIGARALGERILAGLATQPKTTSFTTWLGGDFPLAETGWLVEVNGERAIINSVAVDVNTDNNGAIKVRQTLTVGEQTDNVYTKLLNLLPSPPLLVGRLASSSGEVSVLTLLDGGVITARGTGTVGANYYVRNGLIESAAPNLTLSEIVI